MNIDVAVAQVVSLRMTSDDLQNSLNQMSRTYSPSATNREPAARLTGYFLSIVILRSLATEIMLKVLSFRKTGRYRRDSKGHDLLVLFNDLDGETREIIAKLEYSHGVAPLSQILGKHRVDFIEARYVMESEQKWHIDLLDLDKALTILMELYKHNDFNRNCNPRSGPSQMDA